MENRICDICKSKNIILNKSKELVCKDCGIIQKEPYYMTNKYYVMLKEYNTNNSDYNKKIQSTPTYHLGSTFNSKDKYKKLEYINNQVSNIKIRNRLIGPLLKINNIFQLSRKARIKVLLIAKTIEKYTTKNYRLIDILIVAILFYYRNQRIAMDLKYILQQMKKSGYIVTASRINKILFDIPKNIRLNYHRITVNDRINYCISKIFAYLDSKITDSKLRNNTYDIRGKTVSEVTKICKLREKLNSSSHTSYNAFICKIVYDNMRRVKVGKTPILTYKALGKIFSITESTIRNIRYKTLIQNI